MSVDPAVLRAALGGDARTLQRLLKQYDPQKVKQMLDFPMEAWNPNNDLQISERDWNTDPKGKLLYAIVEPGWSSIEDETIRNRIVAILLQAGAKSYPIILFQACKYGYVDIVKFLLDKGQFSKDDIATAKNRAERSTKSKEISKLLDNYKPRLSQKNDSLEEAWKESDMEDVWKNSELAAAFQNAASASEHNAAWQNAQMESAYHAAKANAATSNAAKAEIDTLHNIYENLYEPENAVSENAALHNIHSRLLLNNKPVKYNFNNAHYNVPTHEELYEPAKNGLFAKSNAASENIYGPAISNAASALNTSTKYTNSGRVEACSNKQQALAAASAGISRQGYRLRCRLGGKTHKRTKKHRNTRRRMRR
jgi:hypothetical protein